MRIGGLRDRITIESPVEETNDAGEVIIVAWQTVAELWASVEPVLGREFFSAAQVQSDITTRIRIRYRTGLTTKMRVKYERNVNDVMVAEYYDIESLINTYEDRRETQLMCRQRTAEGIRDQA